MSKLKNKASSKILVITFSFLILIIVISIFLLIQSSYINQPTTNLPTKEYSSPYPTTKPNNTPPPLPSATPTSKPTNEPRPAFLTYPDNSIEYDGYIFTSLIDEINNQAFIVKIPLNQEISIKNNEIVLTIPNHYEPKHFPYTYTIEFYKYENVLFMTICTFHNCELNYVLHSAKDKPEKIKSSPAAFGNILDSKSKLTYFSTPPLVDSWCNREWYYYYNPEKKEVESIVSAVTENFYMESYPEYSETPESDCVTKIFYGISNHDSLIIGTNDDFSDPYINQIDEYQINPNTNEIEIIPLITAAQAPLIHDVKYHNEKNKLYLLGENIHVLDLETKELSVFYQLNQKLELDTLTLHFCGEWTIKQKSINTEKTLPICEYKTNQLWLLDLDTKEITQVKSTE